MCIFHDEDYVKYLELVGEKVDKIGDASETLNLTEKNQLLSTDTKRCKHFCLIRFKFIAFLFSRQNW